MPASSPTIRSIQLPGRVRLDVAEQGDADGVPLLLLHGVTDSRRSFDRLLPHLPRGLRAIAVSQRGHGDSERPAGGYRPRDFAGDVAALLDRLQIERAVVVGHSMGSFNAQRFAIDHPARLLGLALIGATPSFRSNPDVVHFWRHDIAGLTDPIDPGLARAFQLSTMQLPVPDEFLRVVIAESLKVPARVWRAAFDGFMTEDTLDGLHGIAAPTIILWGRHDAFCRLQNQQALLRIPGSRLSVFEASGHTPHWEEPARCAHELAAFALQAAAAAETAAAR